MRSLAFFCFLVLAAFLPPPRLAHADLDSHDPAWRALLHFEGEASSLSPGAPFFLSPTGHEDAAAELAETKKALSSPDGACRFPARALRLGVKPDGTGELCGRWRAWRDTIAARGVELVFASAFVNSPSSMYGHTLLKFPRGGRTEGEELLDYTLNYGAHTGDSGGLGYVWNGLTGVFRGTFATAPYYLKVKEYLHVEKRDFWVYPLALDPAETELLVAHAWELRDVSSPYYFLKKNCAYYLLQFLEVARPGQGLTSAFPLWAVPMDTIRRLQDRGWLAEPRLRPSRAKVLARRRARLSAEEKTQAAALADGETIGRQPSPEVVATAYDLWRFRHDGRVIDDRARAAELALLKTPVVPAPAPVFHEASPDQGHRSSRAGFSYGQGSKGSFGELAYRGTLHDLLGNPLGFEPQSELSMGDFRFRLQRGEGLSLEHFDLLRIRSLAPWTRWMPSVAWSFRVGAAARRELDCRAWGCTAGLLNGGVGAATLLGPLHVFALWELDVEAGPAFARHWRVASGPMAGFYLPLWRGARLLAEAETRFRLLGESQQRKEARLGLAQDLSRGWELRGQAALKKGWREAQLGLATYF